MQALVHFCFFISRAKSREANSLFHPDPCVYCICLKRCLHHCRVRTRHFQVLTKSQPVHYSYLFVFTLCARVCVCICSRIFAHNFKLTHTHKSVLPLRPTLCHLLALLISQNIRAGYYHTGFRINKFQKQFKSILPCNYAHVYET